MAWHLGLKIWELEPGTCDEEPESWDLGPGTWDLACSTWDLGPPVRDLASGTQGLGSGTLGSGRHLGTWCRGPQPGTWYWDLGFAEFLKCEMLGSKCQVRGQPKRGRTACILAPSLSSFGRLAFLHTPTHAKATAHMATFYASHQPMYFFQLFQLKASAPSSMCYFVWN